MYGFNFKWISTVRRNLNGREIQENFMASWWEIWQNGCISFWRLIEMDFFLLQVSRTLSGGSLSEFIRYLVFFIC